MSSRSKTRSKISKKSRSSSIGRINAQLSQLRQDMSELVKALQVQQSILAGPPQTMVSSGGLDMTQLANARAGFTPSYTPSVGYPGGSAPTVSTPPPPPAPEDPTSFTVDVPISGDFTSYEGAVPLSTACSGSTDEDAQTRSRYNLSEMVYNPTKRRFYFSYCDAVNDSNGDLSNLKFVNEELFKSRLRNARELGPYSADQLAEPISKGRRRTDTECPTTQGSAPSCPAGMTETVPGFCYEPASDITWSSFIGQNPMLIDGKYRQQWCPSRRLDGDRKQTGTIEDPVLLFPKMFGDQPMWRVSPGIVSSFVGETVPGPQSVPPSDEPYDPIYGDEVVGTDSRGRPTIWLCGQGPLRGQEVRDRQRCRTGSTTDVRPVFT